MNKRESRRELIGGPRRQGARRVRTNMLRSGMPKPGLWANGTKSISEDSHHYVKDSAKTRNTASQTTALIDPHCCSGDVSVIPCNSPADVVGAGEWDPAMTSRVERDRAVGKSPSLSPLSQQRILLPTWRQGSLLCGSPHWPSALGGADCPYACL